MLKPDRRQAQALHDLRGNTVVLEYLEACLSDTKNRLTTQRDAEVFRVLQGQAQALQQILDLVNADPTQQSGKR